LHALKLKDRNNNSVLNTLINTSNLIANNANGSNNSFDMSVLNNQLLDLIRQDPFQIEQILKRKLLSAFSSLYNFFYKFQFLVKHLYQLGDQSNLIDEIHQLDQTVPANLAAAVGLTNMSLGISLDQMNNARNPTSRASLNMNQNFNAHHHLQANTSNFNNHNVHANGVNAPNYTRQSNQPMNFPQNQQYNPNFLQLQLQQQQHLNTMQDYQEERFSRKVFVGGLPPDIDEDEIVTHFRQYGNLIVDWPHKAESKSYFPPKGYAFLIFQEERSVQELIETCVMDDNKLYMVVSSPSMKDKPVQIRPWCLADSDFVMDGSQPLDPRKTIFVGGVPRPLKAIELALIMNRFYGGVCYAGIDTDPELKYPKGAGRVAFSNQQSYIAAISARFVQLQHGEIDKRVEVKPYVLDDQMCDECQGARCGGKFAPFFCANVTCLQYYCEVCWATIHTRPGREYHKPLVKEGADRPRPLPYK